MPHLSQIIAITKGKKENWAKISSNARRIFSNKSVLTGFSKRFEPHTTDAQELLRQERPPEVVRVQATVQDILVTVRKTLEELFNVIATQDIANTKAHADIVVNGVTIAEKVPAVYLLFLEKHLDELHNFCSEIPTLDPAKDWKWNKEQGYHVTEPTYTVSTKKIMRVLTLSEATERHPAQTTTYNEDVAVGRNWSIDFSGAMPATEHKALMLRIEALQQAVKFAREEANRTPADLQYTGSKVLGYIFSDLLNK